MFLGNTRCYFSKLKLNIYNFEYNTLYVFRGIVTFRYYLQGFAVLGVSIAGHNIYSDSLICPPPFKKGMGGTCTYFSQIRCDLTSVGVFLRTVMRAHLLYNHLRYLEPNLTHSFVSRHCFLLDCDCQYTERPSLKLCIENGISPQTRSAHIQPNIQTPNLRIFS